MNPEVHIVQLKPMRVASAYGFGESPEEQAWRALVTWAKPKGLLEDLNAHPVFGFNNPYPTPENPRYGYVFWVAVEPGIEPEGNVRIEEFFGGTYAVSRCEAQGHPETNIPLGWKNVVDWCKQNTHPLGRHHALERFITSPDNPGQLVLDLHCPIMS
jgi:DNA gyrase inhibitor GyrI